MKRLLLISNQQRFRWKEYDDKLTTVQIFVGFDNYTEYILK